MTTNTTPTYREWHCINCGCKILLDRRPRVGAGCWCAHTSWAFTRAALEEAHAEIAAVVGFAPFSPKANGIDEWVVIALVDAGRARIERVFVEFNRATYRLFA